MDVPGSLPGDESKVDTAGRPVLQDEWRILDLFTSDEFAPRPAEFALRNGTPGTIAGWKALADGLLTNQSCVFHRNLEISSCYAWMYKLLPECFKWAGMAAFASYHVRLALLPFRLDADRTGYVDIPQSLERHRPHPGGLLAEDVDTVRITNNAIFDDIFWVHLAYRCAPDGIERLRALLGADRRYAVLLAGFEAIDRGRRVLEDRTASEDARRAAEDLIWEGNVQLLEHEQRAVVQPNFDRLSSAYAGLFSLGSTLNFEVRGLRREVSYFTSFYLYAVTRGMPQVVRARTWPRITRFDDRWPWIVTSIVPRFRKFDADARLVDASLRRILAEARAYTSHACVLPPSPQAGAVAPIPDTRMASAVIESELLDGPEGQRRFPRRQ
jgi:hypothetical protein